MARRGFTQEDADHHRECAARDEEIFHVAGLSDDPEDDYVESDAARRIEWHNSMADRIEALFAPTEGQETGELLPCPFCGSDDVALTPRGYVLCNGCSLLADFVDWITTTGGIELYSEEAWVYQWNRRERRRGE